VSTSRTTPYALEIDAALREAEELRARMREAKAKRVRALLAEGMTLADISRAVGLHKATVRKIRDGEWRA
jgi:hypothetical protein